jgi:hypothetical protein
MGIRASLRKVVRAPGGSAAAVREVTPLDDNDLGAPARAGALGGGSGFLIRAT